MAARRILLRTTALGLAAAAARSGLDAAGEHPELRPDHAGPPRRLCPEAPVRARARAELDLKRLDAVGPGGDAYTATDLRLLALLAARDGRADEALRLYAEAARDSLFDERPHALAYYICLLTNHAEEAKHWSAAYRRLVLESEIIHPKFPGYFESEEMADLIGELAVAASLSGVCSLVHPAIRTIVTRCAFHGVDADLAAAQEQDKTPGRLQLHALRVYLYATVQRLVREDVKIGREKQNRHGGDR